MQISLRLGAHGWSDLDLWLEDKHLNFCITHVFNSPLVDVANAVLSLNRGAGEASFTIHEEPGQHVWTMSQIPEEQHLLLVGIQSYDYNFEISKAAFDVTEFRVARDFFIGSFVVEFGKIAFQLGNPRFAKDRASEDFPWEALRELQRGKPKRNEQGDAGRPTTRVESDDL